MSPLPSSSIRRSVGTDQVYPRGSRGRADPDLRRPHPKALETLDGRRAVAVRHGQRFPETCAGQVVLAPGLIAPAEIDERVDETPAQEPATLLHEWAVAIQRAVIEVIPAIQDARRFEAADGRHGVGGLDRAQQALLELGHVEPAHDRG